VYIAMELIDGRTLRDLQQDGVLPTRRLLDIAFQISDGLAKAHGAGIVHRDLKPENIMVTKDGAVKILDFGLAKLLLRETTHGDDSATAVEQTQPGTVMGTIGYMSPEQASGKPVDFRSDQFSLGSILYELATGNRAFQRDTSAETLTAIIREEAEPVGRSTNVPAPSAGSSSAASP
jgi:serine/threonine protein kinase